MLKKINIVAVKVIVVLSLVFLFGCETFNMEKFKATKDGIEVEKIETTEEDK